VTFSLMLSLGKKVNGAKTTKFIHEPKEHDPIQTMGDVLNISKVHTITRSIKRHLNCEKEASGLTYKIIEIREASHKRFETPKIHFLLR